jgi:hypothetical protein
METPLHPQKCTVQRAVSSAGVVRPVFLDVAVNAERYLKLLQDHFVQLFKEWE